MSLFSDTEIPVRASQAKRQSMCWTLNMQHRLQWDSACV